MRPGWPHIILISTTLHATALLGFFALSLPSTSPSPASPENPIVSTLSLQLRSRGIMPPHLIPTSAALPAKALAKGTPVLPAQVAAAPTPPQPDSFALKDQSRSHLRVVDNPILSPTPPPQVNPRDGVVFILDISGSMYEPYAGSTRLALARQFLCERIAQLKEGTPFAITVYGETARRSGPLVSANAATRTAAEAYANQEFDCGGGTDLPVGLSLAEDLRAGSLLLITDGDLNMRRAELLPKAAKILGTGGSSVGLSIIAIAPRLNTPAVKLLQELAKQEDGTYQTGAAPGSLAAIVTRKADEDTP